MCHYPLQLLHYSGSSASKGTMVIHYRLVIHCSRVLEGGLLSLKSLWQGHCGKVTVGEHITIRVRPWLLRPYARFRSFASVRIPWLVNCPLRPCYTPVLAVQLLVSRSSNPLWCSLEVIVIKSELISLNC